jgi:hypothetical protein
MEYKKHLDELRSKLVGRSMSLMVGSGFSKNVSNLFPTWNELLQDLVFEMFRDEINKEFLVEAKIVRRRLNKQSFIKARCNKIISSIGYLDVVSSYLKIKQPESIAVYIESRTPYVYRETNGELCLKMDGCLEVLDELSLSLHRAFIELPWNNIYTTNYDQLLELCVDEEQFNRLTNEIAHLEEEHSIAVERSSKVNSEISALKAKLNDLYVNQTGRVELKPGVSNPEDEQIKSKISILNNEAYSLEVSIDENRDQIRSKESALVNCYNVVKEAASLKLKRNNNIIKLHGSLRTPKERLAHLFGFDGDRKKHYVIAREDYDSYPAKHEAFTQLMRISLLQESFCLVGFSGDDPNFLAWVGWVRDIIQRTANENESHRSYKIYLLDVSSEVPNEDRTLFFENYNIIRIPLKDPHVLKIMMDDLSQINHPTNIKETLHLVVSFFRNHAQTVPIIPSDDLEAVEVSKSIWKNISLFNRGTNEIAISNLVENLGKIKGKIQVQNLVYTYRQKNFLSIYRPAKWKINIESLGASMCQLILLAVQECLLPVNYALDRSIIKILSKEPTTANEIAEMLELEESILMPQHIGGKSGFHKLLSLAFSFRFEELQDFLLAWDPSPDSVCIKAGFLSIFDPDKSIEYLTAQQRYLGHFTHEQKLYLTELHAFIINSIQYPHDKKLLRIIRAYEKAGYRPLYENFNYLEKELSDKLSKTEPLGSDRYSVGRSSYDKNQHQTPLALQYLMLMINTGTQLNIRRTYMISTDKWYTIIEKGYERYPSAFLFYGLQCSDASYLKRLGQDYAYSVNLSSAQLDRITLDLLSAIPKLPYSYRGNVELFLSKLLISVLPSVWEQPIMNIWRNSLKSGEAFKEPHLNPLNALSNFAFQYIEMEDHILEILANCLSASVKDKNDQIISYLFYLVKNIHFKRLSPLKLHESNVNDLIFDVIETLSADNIINLFILGNIREMLSDSHTKAVIDRLTEIDFLAIKNERAWEVIYLFLKGQKRLVKEFKSAILKSTDLWATGIDGTTISGGVEPIQLSAVSYDMNRKNGIVWTDNQLKYIFEKMKIAVNQIHSFYISPDPFFTFSNTILEMLWFVNTHSKRLNGLPEFQDTCDKIHYLHKLNVNYDSVQEGLLSKDQADVVWALSEVAYQYWRNQSDENLLRIVFNKALLQSEPALEATISYISSWFVDGKDKYNWESMFLTLIGILKKYKRQPLQNVDVSFVEEKIVKIAFCLKSKGQNEEIIEWWINHAENSRFNNIRQLTINCYA